MTRLSALVFFFSVGMAFASIAGSKTWGAVKLCSFNIQFLGTYEMRDNKGLADLLKRKRCDVVVIQELVAPPCERHLDRNHSSFYDFPEMSLSAYRKWTRTKTGRSKKNKYPFNRGKQTIRSFPGGKDPVLCDPQANDFFTKMKSAGFNGFVLSGEDTGPQNRTNTFASEWWVTFYKKSKVQVASKSMPKGFLGKKLAGKVSKNKPWSRTPFAIPFKTKKGGFDFVVISVHLQPDKNGASIRKKELLAIDRWVKSQEKKTGEGDFLIVGDFNFQTKAEGRRAIPKGWATLNTSFKATNVALKSPRPYDHILYRPSRSSPSEIKRTKNFTVINLITEMEDRWLDVRESPNEPYPGDQMKLEKKRRTSASKTKKIYPRLGRWHNASNTFKMTWSDHHPIAVQLSTSSSDDD